MINPKLQPILGLAIIILSFIPDAVQIPLVFPFETYYNLDGLMLLSAITPPVVGAMLLLSYAAKTAVKTSCVIAFVLGIILVSAILFSPKLFFPIELTYLQAASLICLVAAMVSAGKYKKVLSLFFTLAIPAALFLYALISALLGTLPIAALFPYKTALMLFAGMQVTINAFSGFRKAH